MSKKFDQRTGLHALQKYSGEDKDFAIDFQNLLKAGDSLNSITSVVSTSESLVTGSSNVTLGTTTIVGTTVEFGIAAGTDGEDYVLKATVDTTDGETLIAEGLLRVRN